LFQWQGRVGWLVVDGSAANISIVRFTQMVNKMITATWRGRNAFEEYQGNMKMVLDNLPTK
jgi:hypothetical protein